MDKFHDLRKLLHRSVINKPFEVLLVSLTK